MIPMATATATPATPATATPKVKGRALTAADKAALATDEANVIRDLRARWAAGTIEHTSADDAFKAAKLAFESTRVILSRVAYAAAMVHPFKGEANLADATKILYSADYGNAAENKKVATKKNTLRPYLQAGVALAKAGMEERTTPPADDDRTVVNDAFEAYNKEQAKARKAASKAAKDAKDTEESADTEESEGRVTDPTPADDDAMTFADILAFMARAKSALDIYVKGGGIITESDVNTFNGAAATIAAELEELIA
ncbi:hypothetical protein FDH86_gp105 [Arthrobacter phage Tank]|uniref:Uncharacterized protein n=1 Tax=Arthrobacter phage Tank TaxID=1772319 RepID=A0A0U4B7F1_9CAUD|nr:hypothetical protein FDH86_gp105 [Arthrobacter phage Tank]ALY10640.1 hypothetical protein TANK_105 [Arthrobacter phage Tank]